MALSWIVFLLGMATTLVADPLLADEFGTGSFGFGMLTALWGGGTILGSGPKGAYLVGGVTGTLGASLLVPLLRWLPRRTAAGAAERLPGSEPFPSTSPADATRVATSLRRRSTRRPTT
jgi:hypothetical protein